MFYAVNNLIITTLKFIKVVATAIKDPYTFTAVLLAKTITYIKFYKIIN